MATHAADPLREALLAPEYLQDPYPTYRHLRETDPVHWFEPWGAWIVTRYADVLDVLRGEGKTFSVRGRIRRAVDAMPEASRASFEPIVDHFSTGLLHSDPPDHTRLRGLISAAFTPKSIAEDRAWIQRLVDDLLDELGDASRFDVLAQFAYPLPATVVARVLGLPPEDRFKGKVWADAVSSFFGSNRLTLEVARHGQENLMAARRYLTAVADDKQTAPQPDVLSRLVAAQDRGDPISDGELLSTAVTFLVGGHETTTAMITSGLLRLAEFPEELERLRADEALLETAVDEILRLESPNQRILRIALQDVEVGGREIHAGQQVMLLLGAANRDPEQFSEPDRLDVGRSPNRHLAFAMGAHFCIGAPLARLEGVVALGTFLRRYPRYAIEGRPEWIGSPTLRLLQSLWLDVN
jgi:cytochrome P450